MNAFSQYANYYDIYIRTKTIRLKLRSSNSSSCDMHQVRVRFSISAAELQGMQSNSRSGAIAWTESILVRRWWQAGASAGAQVTRRKPESD